jgi:hypothetical protein
MGDVVSNTRATSTRQLLRFGRGSGYRAALATRAVEDVLACVLDDPRWDRQVEDRDDYYASLLIRLDADVQPIVEHIARLEADDPRGWLPVGVLAQMAWRGHPAASSGLAVPLERAVPAPMVREGVVAALRKRLEHVSVPELIAVAQEMVPLAPLVELLLQRGVTASEPALHVAVGEAGPRSRAVALRTLGKLGHAGYVDDARAYLEQQRGREGKSDELRSAYVEYLADLPGELTLPLARAWFDREWPMSLAAEKIFSLHATADDRVRLERAGSAALVSGDMYRLCSVLEGLGVIGDPASVPLLCRAYAEAPYSFARRAALGAALQHRVESVTEVLVESLWDCEAASRVLACEAVPLDSPGVVERLRELAEDVLEDAGVSGAAAERLARQASRHDCGRARTRSTCSRRPVGRRRFRRALLRPTGDRGSAHRTARAAGGAMVLDR